MTFLENSTGLDASMKAAQNQLGYSDSTTSANIDDNITSARDLEVKLQEANTNLEKQVEKRTQELEDVVNELLKSNRKLEASQLETCNALRKEKQLNELKSRFVSMASHEFRTPLSTILSSASLIQRYTEVSHNEKVVKHIERIKSSVLNLTGILDDFLSLGKLEEGRIEVKLQEVDIEELCDQVSAEMQGSLGDHQSIVRTVEGTPTTVLTDPRIMRNIMTNLASNAIKYSKPEGVIECKKSYLSEGFSISYIDHGIGIPKNEQEHLFQRFFRATNVENIQGTGLGLNIVKRYVDLLDGEISFISEEGVGSTFTVKLSS